RHVPAPPAICPLSLHDALPISRRSRGVTRLRDAPQRSFELLAGGDVELREDLVQVVLDGTRADVELATDLGVRVPRRGQAGDLRSEEHTSELQSRENLVCRLLL